MTARRMLIIAALLALGTAWGAQSGAMTARPVVVWGLAKPVRVVTTAGSSTPSGAIAPANVCAYPNNSKTPLSCFKAEISGRDFFRRPMARIVAFAGSKHGVLFEASYNAGGSGSSNFWALLVFGSRGSWKDLLPDVTTSEQGDELYWHSAELSPYGLFTVADYKWGKGETHFGPHKYEIKTYKFCPSRGAYVLADQYLTSAKFPGLDETDAISVIKPSFAEIRARLLRHPHPGCN